MTTELKSGPPETRRVLKDGTVIEKKWSYCRRNGHSAWDGYSWRHYFVLTTPDGLRFIGSPRKNGGHATTPVKVLRERAENTRKVAAAAQAAGLTAEAAGRQGLIEFALHKCGVYYHGPHGTTFDLSQLEKALAKGGAQ